MGHRLFPIGGKCGKVHVSDFEGPFRHGLMDPLEVLTGQAQRPHRISFRHSQEAMDDVAAIVGSLTDQHHEVLGGILVVHPINGEGLPVALLPLRTEGVGSIFSDADRDGLGDHVSSFGFTLRGTAQVSSWKRRQQTAASSSVLSVAIGRPQSGHKGAPPNRGRGTQSQLGFTDKALFFFYPSFL